MGSEKGSGFRGQGSEFRHRRVSDAYASSAVHMSGVGFRAWWLVALLVAAVPVGIARAEDATDAHPRQKIENLTVAEKKKLLRWQERFAKLDLAERQRLWQLHDDLQHDQKGDELRKVMQRYHEWLMTLSPRERRELLDLEPAERIEKIAKIREEEAKRPNEKDLEAVFKWFEARVRRSPPESIRQRVGTMSEWERRRVVYAVLRKRWQGNRDEPPPPPPTKSELDELDELRSMLSERSRKLLEQEPQDEQWQVVVRWIPQAFFHHMGLRPFGGPRTPEQQAQHQAELDRFFHNLPEGKQGFLLSLPAEDMLWQLRKEYLGIPEVGPFGRRGRGPGPPGPRRDGPRRPGRESEPDRRSGPPEWGPPRHRNRPPAPSESRQ